MELGWGGIGDGVGNVSRETCWVIGNGVNILMGGELGVDNIQNM